MRLRTVDLGRKVADTAREVILGEVLLPYDRLIGQSKQPDTLRGFAGQARLSFGSAPSTASGG